MRGSLLAQRVRAGRIGPHSDSALKLNENSMEPKARFWRHLIGLERLKNTQTCQQAQANSPVGQADENSCDAAAVDVGGMS